MRSADSTDRVYIMRSIFDRISGCETDERTHISDRISYQRGQAMCRTGQFDTATSCTKIRVPRMIAYLLSAQYLEIPDGRTTHELRADEKFEEPRYRKRN